MNYNEQRFAEYVGSVKLWGSVLDMSIQDAHGQPVGESYGGAIRRAVDEARLWFRDDSYHIGSFRY